MKRFLTLCLLLAGSAVYAQPGVYDVHPAGDPSGKILTMEEAIYRGVGYSRGAGARWETHDTFRFTRDGQTLVQGIQNGKLTQARPQEGEPAPAAGPQRPLLGNATSAFSRDGSLYIHQGGRDVAIAVSEGPGIVYGESVSRNEMGIGEGFYWSPSRNKLAFYRKDETRVTLFPLLDITSRTGTLREIRYPMNGMPSEHISLGVYDLETARTVYMQVTDFSEERYLTNITWSPDDRYIFIQVVDRAQHHMHLNQYSATTGAFIRTLLTEENDAWIEPLDHLYFIKGRTDLFLYRTDNRDGYRNLYLTDTLGTTLRRLTAVDADVEYVANDGKSVYYTSAEVSPVENHLYRIDLTLPKKNTLQKAKFGKPVALTPERGWHTVSMNEDLTWFLDTYSNFNKPSVSLIRKTDGKVSEILVEATDPLAGYASCEVDLGTVKSADGKFDNYYRLFKPLNFDPSKKYPVIVYVYGGPHSQLVQDTWLGGVRMWEMLMAQKGYLVYVQDNRGTPNRGAAFEKAINRRCGVAEMADQMEGIKMLKSLPYVDADRIGVHGWSYGGFMTISLMTTYPDTFKVGVAGGPVIDWKWYEVMYGERYMDNPDTNPEGFAETSLINKAKNLKGKLLICQGAIDDTVVWQHSLNFVQQCIDQEIQLDYFPYPTDPHNVRGYRRIHLMDKVTMYFDEYL